MEHLILLHGALGHPGYFDFIKQQFADQFIIHTPAFYGHAGSELPAGPLTMQRYIDQLEQYCMANGVERASFFGYSMGGYVALCYASRFPDRTAAVMTLATKLAWSPDIARKEVMMLDPDVIKSKVPKFAAALSAVHGAEKWEPLTHGIASLLTDLGAYPLLDAAAMTAVTAPMQLMVGDKDNMVSIEETLQAYQQIKGAGLAVLPHTIHPFETINQKLLLQLMKDFFIK